MTVLIALLLAATPPAPEGFITAEAALARYRVLTSTVVTCAPQKSDAGEIVVCGRRDLDRYRAWNTEDVPGAPGNDGEPAYEERARLLGPRGRCASGPGAVPCAGGR